MKYKHVCFTNGNIEAGELSLSIFIDICALSKWLDERLHESDRMDGIVNVYLI